MHVRVCACARSAYNVQLTDDIFTGENFKLIEGTFDIEIPEVLPYVLASAASCIAFCYFSPCALRRHALRRHALRGTL